MRVLPRGTVTFLFTDVEGSTRLLKELRDGYGDVLASISGSCGAAFAEAVDLTTAVHVGVIAPFPPDPVNLARAQLARARADSPGTYAWKDFVFDNVGRSYCLRDDRSATQLVFGGAVSRHIIVVSITDSRLLGYLPVTVAQGSGIQPSEHYCRGEPLQA